MEETQRKIERKNHEEDFRGVFHVKKKKKKIIGIPVYYRREIFCKPGTVRLPKIVLSDISFLGPVVLKCGSTKYCNIMLEGKKIKLRESRRISPDFLPLTHQIYGH